MVLKLSTDVLDELEGVVLPKFIDFPKTDNVICHIGVGGFHRGHQALYIQEMNDLSNGENLWSICGIGLLKKDRLMRDALANQDFLYAVLSQDRASERVTVVNSIRDFKLLDEGIDSIVQYLADKRVKIVSLTVTESGYSQNELGDVDFDLPMIQNDVKNIAKPKTPLGLIVSALRLRNANGIRPFTVMCCDNLQENGHMIKKLVIQLAEKIDPNLAKWIDQNVAFPNSMVDRITPQTETKHVDYISKKYGLSVCWPVVCEEFRQWVIEDLFCNARPPFEKVGIEIVPNVREYELMKLRLLNASHSALAYVSNLIGYKFVHEAMADDVILGFVTQFMDEIGKSLKPIKGVDYAEYKKSLIDRFQNEKIADTIDRLCIDGSSKLANFMQDAIIELSTGNERLPAMEFAFAGWIRYLAKFEGNEAAVHDKRARELVPIAVELSSRAPADVSGFLKAVFPNLLQLTDFVQGLSKAFDSIGLNGCKGSMKLLIEQ